MMKKIVSGAILIFLKCANGILVETATVHQSPCIGHSGEIDLSMDDLGNETYFEIPELNGTAFCTGGSDADSWNVCNADHFLGDVYEIVSVELQFNASNGESDGSLDEHTMCVYSIEYEVADETTLLADESDDGPCLQREILQCCGWDDDGDLDLDISVDNVTGEFVDIEWSCGDTAVCRPPSEATNYTIHDSSEFKSFWFNAMDGGSIEASCECFFEYSECDSSDSTTTTTNVDPNETTDTPTSTDTTEFETTLNSPAASIEGSLSSTETSMLHSSTMDVGGTTTESVNQVEPTEDGADDSSSAFSSQSIHLASHLSFLMIVSLLALI